MSLEELLGLNVPPVAVAFLPSAPAGVPRVASAGPAGIPRRGAPFGVAVFGPHATAPFTPDVVLVRGNARQIMLLAEAARAAGIGQEALAMLRPTCAMLPESIGTERARLSLGRIGNRVYTGLGDDEFYFAIPGPKVSQVVGELATIVNANRELEKFHRGRQAAG